VPVNINEILRKAKALRLFFFTYDTVPKINLPSQSKKASAVSDGPRTLADSADIALAIGT